MIVDRGWPKARILGLLLPLMLVGASCGGDAPTPTGGAVAPQEGPSVGATPAATRALSPTPGSPRVEELIKATRDPEWKTRWDAVNALGELGDPAAIPSLAERALRDDNSHPRWRSLWAIGSIQRQGGDAKPFFLAGLLDPDPVVVRNSAVALAFFGQPEARPELLRGLKDPDDFRRWEAVFSLKEVPSPEVVGALRLMLDPAAEAEERVRSEVALALGTIGDKGLIPDLMSTLRSDPSPSVRMRASLALARIGDPSVVPAMEEVLASETDQQAREFLQNAIKDLKGRPAP